MKCIWHEPANCSPRSKGRLIMRPELDHWERAERLNGRFAMIGALAIIVTW